MVFNNTFLKYLTEDSTLESNPLMSLSEDRQLKAFVHSGYFEPMDTYREYLNLNKLWDSGENLGLKLIENFYKNKKVLITGHTGFKGSWLSLMLYNLNAKVSGLSDSSINSGFYSELKKENIFQEELIGNINDYDFLKKNILKKDFDIIFHFAAQGIVSKAKEDVNETLMTNIFGTYNICKISNLSKISKL